MKTNGISITQFREISSFQEILESDLVNELGHTLCHTILQWCGLIPYDKNRFWEMYIAKNDAWSTIGITGLYSNDPRSCKVLWLGWFGVIPDYRNRGIGSQILKLTLDKAKKLGCKEIYIYTDQDNTKAKSLYTHFGFKNMGLVKDNNESIYIDDLLINSENILLHSKIESINNLET